MNKVVYVTFGLPGAGKSYVADIIASELRCVSYNGDEALPLHMKEALHRKDTITDDMRHEFVNAMVDAISILLQTNDKLVVHQTFLKEFMRLQFFIAFPFAQFLLVQTPDAIREKRYMKRKYFNLGIDYLRHMSRLFEPAGIPHTIIENIKDGDVHIRTQLKQIIPDNP